MAVPLRQNYNFYRKYLYNFVLLYKNRSDLKMFLEVLLSLVTVCIFIILAIRPTLVTIATLISEIKSKEQINIQLEQKIQHISQAQQQYEQYKNEIAILNDSVPASALPHIYIRQVEGLISKHSLLLEEIKAEKVLIKGQSTEIEIPPEDDQRLALPDEAKVYEFVISASGSYGNLLTFLKDVEQTRRPFVIDSAIVNSVAETKQSKIILTLRGRLFYFP